MNALSEKQLKTRWQNIKVQIKERPLLAYHAEIPLDKWDDYMGSIPNAEEINRIYHAIQEDKKKKTHRIKDELSKIVGYREAKLFSRKTKVSDTAIRQIIEGKKETVGYSTIDRLELFISLVNPDFKPSVENPLNAKKYTNDYIGDIASDMSDIANHIKYYCNELTENARKMKKSKDWNRQEDIKITASLERNIERLKKIKDDIETFWEVYVDRKV